MKLVTYLSHGRVALGALTADGSSVVDLRVAGDASALLSGGTESLTAARVSVAIAERRRVMRQTVGLCLPVSDLEFRASVLRPGKIVCVGLNYRSHLAEIGDSIPGYPILFHKCATSVIGHRQAIVLPRVSQQVDYEGELAVAMSVPMISNSAPRNGPAEKCSIRSAPWGPCWSPPTKYLILVDFA
jgi:2-keto-4-pentenoate hydratase/2-oxohepta-3-ene-1,7-dioic acid hydratase in catechol pathway